MKKEIWKFIPSTNKVYKISTYGNVLSLKTNRILKPVMVGGKRHLRYKAVSITYNKIGKKRKMIHRLVAECFIKKVDGKDFVNHIDGNKLNNHISNLEWVTTKENSHHCWINGLQSKKLKINEVIEIKNLLLKDVSIQEICSIYNVKYHNILSIKNKKIWRYF